MNNFLFNNSLQRGKIIVQELKSTIPNHRKWIGIYPIKKEFHVQIFEVNKIIHDEYFGEGDKKNLKKVILKNRAELVFYLEKENILLSDFQFPWNTDYPL